jgi:hypothetical protein
MDNFRVVCVNDSGMPSTFPKSSWIKKGSVYTVVDAAKLARQHMVLGYKLAEVDMPSNSPYEYFLANRFRPYSEDDAIAEKLVEELIEELELENV